MSITQPLAEAERDLRGALRVLRPGEVITLVDETGASVGKLSAVDEGRGRSKAGEEKTNEESFQDAWDRLAEDVSTSWQSEKSALEELRDQRNARLFKNAPRCSFYRNAPQPLRAQRATRMGESGWRVSCVNLLESTWSL